jgi:NAD-dependent SIR2 family protein deacetylase
MVAGCAMDVSPASELPVLASRAGATIVEIKRTPSRLGSMIPVHHVAGPAEHVLARLEGDDR